MRPCTIRRLLAELVRIDSVNPDLDPKGRGEAEIAAFLGRYLKSLGLKVEFQRIAPGRVNVVGILKGAGKGPVLMLNGHMDTVAAAGAGLKPVIRGNRMSGRGAADMKGGIAAMVLAVQRILEQGIRPRGDVLLAMVADEEYASIGTEALVKRYSADGAVVCEPSQLKVVVAHKGFSWARVTVLGRAAHGSLPDRGVDAIVKAGKFLVEIEKLGLRLKHRRHPLLQHASLHASLINGGTELSTYPAKCRIDLERRTLPGEEKGAFQHELNRIIRRLKQQDPVFQAKAEVFFSRHPLETPKTGKIVGDLVCAFREVAGVPPAFAGMYGWGDSQLLDAAGIPSVIFGPKGAGFHGDRECVDLKSVETTASVLARLIQRFCG